MATIQDVAQLAQVSAGTVSRVLSNHPAVAPENFRRVQQAIKELNYSPKQRKASMAQAYPLDGKNVLLLMLGMDRSLTRLPVVAAAIEGVEKGLNNANANLLMVNVPTADTVPEVMRRTKVDGIIVKGALQGDLSGHTSPELIETLAEVPTVWVLGRPAGFVGDDVRANDLRVGQLAAEYLVSRGHTDLAFISPKPTQVTLMRRQASFSFYAGHLGATVWNYIGDDRQWSFPSAAVDHVEIVQGLVDRLLAARQRPTAIFAPDDSVGAMVAQALASRGLQIGRDISLMSCNNEQSLLMGIYPRMTTIDVHAEQIGSRCVDQLAWRMNHPNQPFCDIGLDPTLVEGGSVARHSTT
ncbi:LacI family DNA-binding transcriptional regulator [Planctomicrobium sp. SH661]|uniref:LacI family DNA-binding transcriptional regulator n=1 Tax=Planctomicrobium sp. SH661 TaxID=3448124 RepID=UPI003F5C55DA